MDSLSKQPGGRVAIPVGNTTMKDPDKGFTPPDKVRAYQAPPGEAGEPPSQRKKDIFQPVPDFELDEYPRESKKARAIYPPDAKQMGIQAVVTLSVEVRSNGAVRRAKVISVRPKEAERYGFGKAAAKALRNYRFQPGRFKGRAVDVVIRYTYRFELD
jgi:TonB family protein